MSETPIGVVFMMVLLVFSFFVALRLTEIAHALNVLAGLP